MSLCLTGGAKAAVLAWSAFTLSWTHSVEKIRWEESWRVEPAGLVIEEARVKGSGAGMDPPAEARLEAGWWRWRPDLPPRERLILAVSGATGGGWRLCGGAGCLDLPETPDDAAPYVLAPCGDK